MKTHIFQPCIKKAIGNGGIFLNRFLLLCLLKRYNRIVKVLLIFYAMLCVNNEAISSITQGFKVTSLDSGEILLDKGWKFHPGDNPLWANSDFNDSNWVDSNPTIDIHYLNELREAEIGWFRLHLDVDKSLLNIPLALTIFQRGASEIYLNGKLIHSLGVVSQDDSKEVIFNPNHTPYSFQFENHPNQVLAVRFSFTKGNPYMNFLGLWSGNPALVMQLDHMDEAIENMIHSKVEVTSRLVGKTTFLLFLALLNLFFFITYPTNKTHLYYSIFIISLAFGYFLEHIFRFMPREGDSYFNVGMFCSLFFGTFIIWGILDVYSFAKKPFEMKELKVRINHPIEGRSKIREKFSRSPTLQPSEIGVSSMNEKFLTKALGILEENIMNTDFNVGFFSKEIGMSRTNLHRKLKALTDHSATEFIRVYRLKRAKYLLEQKVGNISEVAYAVGFTSVGYFTKCFKSHYGQTPSDVNNGSVQS